MIGASAGSITWVHEGASAVYRNSFLVLALDRLVEGDSMASKSHGNQAAQHNDHDNAEC